MNVDVSAFKAYDIRGIYPDQINTEFITLLGCAYATVFRPKEVVIGFDSRLSSPELASALSDAFRKCGVDVADLGLCGTEMVYYATGRYQTDGGIMITASHNPKNYNGCKMVASDAVPVGVGSGLETIRDLVHQRGPFRHARTGTVIHPGCSQADTRQSGQIPAESTPAGETQDKPSQAEITKSQDVQGQQIQPEINEPEGRCTRRNINEEFSDWMLGQLTGTIDPDLEVVVNCGNGAAGPLIKTLQKKLPCTVHTVFEEPDGHFPNGVPNPLLPECREDTAGMVRKTGANLGVAFDGDFDRCFFFDEKGRFIEGYYVVGLLARQILNAKPGSKIIYDPRLTWNTIDTVKRHGGIPVVSKTGHAFIKEKMRLEQAEYGGEMSAHHYFRNFWYCDTGIYPFLLILELLSESKKPFSELVDEAIRNYPVSGELNFTINEPADTVLKAVEVHFKGQDVSTSRLDGLAMEFEQWRFSLRASNTEPLLRLNVESRGDIRLMEQKRDEIITLIQKFQ